MHRQLKGEVAEDEVGDRKGMFSGNLIVHYIKKVDSHMRIDVLVTELQGKAGSTNRADVLRRREREGSWGPGV